MSIFPWLLNKVRSGRLILFFLVSVALYALLRFFESQITHFIIPFFPVEVDKSFGFYRDFVRLCSDEWLWLTFYFSLAWFLFVYVPLHRFIDGIEKQLFQRSRLYVGLIFGLWFMISLITSFHTLQEFPNSADEYVYLFQAETMSEGKLWQTPHPLFDFFHINHIAQKEGLRVGRFPPGWPLVLSAAFILKIPPAIINPILGLLSLILFYFFTKRIYNKMVAIWSLVSVALSAYFIFNSASFFSHTSCLLFAVGFVYGIYEYERKNLFIHALMAGVFLGMVVISRYYTAAIIFLPVGLYLLNRYKVKCIPALFWIGLGCLPFLIFLYWYNFKITGNGFLPVTMWINNQESLGFVQGHSVMKAFEHIVRRFFMFLYWCSPTLVILYFIFLLQKIKDKSDRLVHAEDYIFLLLIVGYFFYHHIGGNQYGPRFFLEGLPFLTVFVVRKIFQTRHKWTLSLFTAGLIYGIVKIPFIANREHRIITERVDMYRQAQEQKIENAVILIGSSTGLIRPMQQPELARNSMDYKTDLIYAWYIEDRNQELMDYYPNRSFYKYVRDPDSVEGKFIKLK
ncbi:MAG: glycosyltransferase family 39 protein [Cyclobacteriaceae bacterium]